MDDENVSNVSFEFAAQDLVLAMDNPKRIELL